MWAILEISGFVRALWSVLRMTEASETTKWSLQADNICSSAHVFKLTVSLKVSVAVWGRSAVCVCLLCVQSTAVCVLSRQRHDRRKRWFSLAAVASQSAREPTRSKWYSLVLNAWLGRPALLQPPVSCYIMTRRWQGTTLIQREKEKETQQEGWAVMS